MRRETRWEEKGLAHGFYRAFFRSWAAVWRSTSLATSPSTWDRERLDYSTVLRSQSIFTLKRFDYVWLCFSLQTKRCIKFTVNRLKSQWLLLWAVKSYVSLLQYCRVCGPKQDLTRTQKPSPLVPLSSQGHSRAAKTANQWVHCTFYRWLDTC